MEYYVECPDCRIALDSEHYKVKVNDISCTIDTDCPVCGEKYQLDFVLVKKRNVSK